MAAFAPLNLKNNAAVEVVFNPTSIDSNGVATFLTNDSSYDAKKVATMSVKLPTKGGTMTRIKQKVLIPIMDTIDATKKVGEAYVVIEASIPKIASESVRLDLRAHAADFLSDAVTTAAYQNLEAIY